MILIQNTDTSTNAEWELSLRENEKNTFNLSISYHLSSFLWTYFWCLYFKLRKQKIFLKQHFPPCKLACGKEVMAKIFPPPHPKLGWGILSTTSLTHSNNSWENMNTNASFLNQAMGPIRETLRRVITEHTGILMVGEEGIVELY